MRAVTTVLLALLLGLVVGCGPPGDEPRAGWRTYEPVGHEYRVRYLEPPWGIEETHATSLTLKIKSNAERIVPDAALIVPPKYLLEVDATGGGPNAQRRIEAKRSELVASGETIVVAPRAVTTDAGDTGFELLSDYTEAGFPGHRRIVYLDRRPRGSGVVSLAFDATPALDEPQVDEMIAGVEVDPQP